ncbi:MAG: thiamine phosphate synthase [Geminicoccaceae bacterium]
MSRGEQTFEGPSIDPAEAGTRLILAPPAGTPAGLIEPVLTEPLVAALLLPPGLSAADARSLVARCIGVGKAALTRDVGEAAGLRASGVHLDGPAAVEAARQRLGKDAILGVGCGLSRHDAMVAGEAGADYLLLGALAAEPSATVEMVEWWLDLFVLPCAVACSSGSDTLPDLLAVGVDFLWVGDNAWADPAREVGALAGAIAAARR